MTAEEQYLESLQKQMMYIYLLYCWPVAHLNTDGELVNLENKWRDVEAEQAYNALSSQYAEMMARVHREFGKEGEK